MKYQNIREEELKNKVGQDFFYDFDTYVYAELITNQTISTIQYIYKPKDSKLFEKLSKH